MTRLLMYANSYVVLLRFFFFQDTGYQTGEQAFNFAFFHRPIERHPRRIPPKHIQFNMYGRLYIFDLVFRFAVILPFL